MCTFLEINVRRRAALGICLAILTSPMYVSAGDSASASLVSARDQQNLPKLDAQIAQLRTTASSNTGSAEAQYQTALAYSYAAEVSMELHDKKKSATYAEDGIDYARKAVDESGSNAEYHRLLGNMCGQVIPANPLLGAFKYGQCARDEITRAIQLDSHSALAYLSQGVGNFYLPASMGGGPDIAVKDFDKAILLDPKLADAYLWKGLALKKENHIPEARAALEKAVAMDPARVWAKQELDKTPAP